MNKTSIEWVRNPDGSPGYTFNPITGCLNNCSYCYARKLANGRLRQRYLANENISPLQTESPGYHTSKLIDSLDPFYPRFWEDRLGLPIEHPTPMRPAKRKGIFVCDMSDLFGIGIPESWTEQVMTTIKLCPYHRFYLLTKQPQNLIKFQLPENCWVGVTVTHYDMMADAVPNLACIDVGKRFISFEPLLERIPAEGLINFLNWVIIGACTGRMVEIAWLCGKYPDLIPMPYGKIWTAQPKIEWVEEIISAADKAGVKVFLKDNLMPLLHQLPQSCVAWTGWGEQVRRKLRQEMPNV